ncbi:MAG: Crp/Fnr family transcriptional regulator [Planctomycetaceae bacterium]|nr:Crp/Fnr family transcriptional regulator [Planctomycetaceae bacterium]
MIRSTDRRPFPLALTRLAAPLLGVAVAVVLIAAAAPSRPAPQDAAPTKVRKTASGDQPMVLVFSRTKGFRHGSIPSGIKAMRGIGKEYGFRVEATEDPTWFQPEKLSKFDGVVFLNTTGDVLDDEQQKSFEAFIRGGGGYVGVHSAADTEYDWPWYGRLVGAYFKTHPRIQPATINVENRTFPATKFLPEKWQRTDEWYVYRENPRPKVKVLLSLDESSYEGGGMNGDHPIAWYQEYDGGRAFYTGGGHTNESYEEPMFRRHLGEAVMWSTGKRPIPGTPQNGKTKTKAENR